MKNSSSILIKLFLFVSIISTNNCLYSQYLRDSTEFIGLSNAYPGNDSAILNLYGENEKHHLTFSNIFSIPEVMVSFDAKEIPFFFDFGNSGNISITTNIADSIKYVITDTSFTYTPDGKVRGRITRIVLSEFKTLGQSFYNEKGTLSDWSIYSTDPFNGLIGLKYLGNMCFTISYPQKLLAISNQSIVPELSNIDETIIPLEDFEMHPYGIHFKGKVNGQDAIIYFDTGKSHSEINQSFVLSDKIVSDKSGVFYNGTIEIVLGKKTFHIDYPRVKQIKRNIEGDLPIGVYIGSDILKYLLLTVDRTNNHNLLIIH